MHTYQRQNYLNVCFDSLRGLKLNWNFKDIGASQHYFRHIFVISCQKALEVYDILASLYKKMKHGDLFCCVYPNNSYIYRIGKWVQKSQLNSFTPERYLRQVSNRSIDHQIIAKLIEAASKQAEQFDQPVLINFLGVNKFQADFYRNQVMRHRSSSEHEYSYIVNLFGDFEHSRISVHSGINEFKTDVPDFSDHADFYHKTINSATVQTATIELTAINGQLTLFNEVYWRDIDFNRIGATYYGPSSAFEMDSIYFYSREKAIDFEHEFELRLRIRLFSNKVLESVKRIKINFYRERGYYPTFHDYKPYLYFPEKNICLMENPNRCEMVVKYKLQKEEKIKNPDLQQTQYTA